MNLVLLTTEDFVGESRVRLSGARSRHLREVHRVEVGRVLEVGLLGGRVGEGRVTELDAEAVVLEVSLRREPPPSLSLGVVLALPRPKVLRRSLTLLTSLGVKDITFVNAARVEKSYWQSEELAPERVREACIKGLEQARDTRLPEVRLRQRFRPFVEDELPSLARGTRAFVAHPGASAACPSAVADPLTLVVGPEGGWVPFELELLVAMGFEPVRLGERALTVEVALAALIGRLAVR